MKTAALAAGVTLLPINASFSSTPEGEFEGIKPVRISGAVHSGPKGIGGVAVSDGLSVVYTDKNGEFNFISDGIRRFVFISLPSGYTIPVTEKGTALFYREIIPDNGEFTADFQLQPNTEDDTKHTFLALADPQTLDEEDMERFHKETIPDIKSHMKGAGKNLFGVSCGDIMFNNLEFYPDYEKGVKNTGIPFFQVLGNHDCEVLTKTDEESVKTFQDHFGPAYYSFNRGKVHYVVLDDIFWFGKYIGYLSKTQLDWLKADLKKLQKGSPVVIFIHIPVMSTIHERLGGKRPDDSVVITNRELLYKILEPFKSFFICGHTHEIEYLKDGNSEIHICGAVCGAWWTGDICWDGAPNGYMVYEVDGTDLKWYYKATGQLKEHQIRLYKPGSDPENKEALIANVWNADEEWQVYWYEDGNKKGEMEKKPGLDPLAVELYDGKDKPAKHKWVNPRITGHLFYAEPAKNSRKILVEAFDKWQNRYTAELEL